MIKFLVGLILGFCLALGYYDGFVAKDYKDRIFKAQQALIRADEEIVKRDEQILILCAAVKRLLEEKKSSFFHSVSQN
jgi:hypothetical protein